MLTISNLLANVSPNHFDCFGGCGLFGFLFGASYSLADNFIIEYHLN
jgi:hypothetical protein